MDFMDFVKRELEIFTDQAKKVGNKSYISTVVCNPLH